MFSLKALALAIPVLFAGSAEQSEDPYLGTFSIVAFDPETGDVGIAMSSKALAVGSIGPYARPGVGAIATQAAANVSFGPRGLDMLEGGMAVEDVMKTLLDSDDGRARRQVGIIDIKGNVRTYTGDGCGEWARGIAGEKSTSRDRVCRMARVTRPPAPAWLLVSIM